MKIGYLFGYVTTNPNDLISQYADKSDHSFHPYPTIDDIIKAIIENTIDTALITLDNITPDRKSVIIPTAILAYQPKQFKLLIKDQYYLPIEDLKLTKGAFIGCQTNYQAAVLQYLNPTIHTKLVKVKDGDYCNTMEQNNLQAILLPEVIDTSSFSNIQTTLLHNSELPRLVGSCTWCFVTLRDNIQLRNQLTMFHNQQAAEISNLERKVQAYFWKDHKSIGAYTFKDENAYFHTTVVLVDNDSSKVAKASLSRSTIVGMDTAIIDLLIQHKQ